MAAYAYTGCRTSRARAARGQGIEVWSVDNAGSWRHVQRLDGLVNPSYLLVDRHREVLYAVHGDEDYVSAFTINPRNGMLALLNRQSTEGRNPVHLCLTREADFLVIANYATGTAAALPVRHDGSLVPVANLLRFEGHPGPRGADQRGPHPHQALRVPHTNRLIFPDKGCDLVRIVDFDASQGQWVAGSQTWIQARPGSGPRHAVLSADGELLYVVNELDSTLATYSLDSEGGCRLLHLCPLLPVDFQRHNQAAGIVLDEGGRRIIVSNRGHDSLAVMALDSATGVPLRTHWVSTQGRTPRFITTDPSGCDLIVANEDSDTIKAFALRGMPGQSAGGLPRTLAETGSPTCVAFYSADCRTDAH
ncbi:lactonase family protein [Cupriavidus lacunae]|uniref:Lactonase family protein n=1 Tax=Cupriavidus lacunae TaxID=2666307 RepID=A0A370NPF5_9BURK|nr:lactonase family protein [Cupriavidus lacunae]RDK07506.1 hypothetical protein DN412_25730 [Cupriavidus lacunae]